MGYKEEDYLQLSGLQHFKFCRRQWALIHIEDQWKENARTIDGYLMHENAHNADLREKRGDLLIIRDMRVFSPTLGVIGACDVVEFRKDEGGVFIAGEEGKCIPFPVEYKHGSPRKDTANELQLCGQAICLEEMLCCDIPQGALYFGDTHHRVMVDFTPELRQEVWQLLQEMHELFRRGVTPKVKPSKSCNACSLKDICVPKLLRQKPIQQYLAERMEGME